MQGAYVEWCASRGMSPTIVTLPEPATETAAAEATSELLDLDPVPDAIFATLDNIALGALRAPQAAGVAVPDDVALTSGTESRTLNWTTPSITAVDGHAVELGARAAELLIARLEDRQSVSGSVTVRAHIVERGSTARPSY